MTPDQIAPIANYSPIEFGRWLYTGFDTLLDRSKRFKAFEPIDRLIGFSRDQTIVDDLADVFSLLDSDGKRSFKAGLRDALSRILVEMPVPSDAVVDSLLLLAQRVHSTDVLPEIEKLVTSDCLQRFRPEQQPIIFARALETVRAYRPYYEVARIILKKFAHHPLFRPGYSLRALVACLVSDKGYWPDAFETFRRKMAGTQIQLSFEQKLELKEKISKNDVQDAIKRGVFRLLGNNDLGFASDDWFVNLMECQGLKNSRGQVPPAHSDYPVTFRCFSGRNPRTAEVRSQIEDYSYYDDTILICGEHGVGKGIVANTIRKSIITRNQDYKADFECLDSRDIQPEFIKDELLGRRNLFEEIRGGILFLHNIGYVSDTNQKGLLKWLGRWDYNRKKLNMDIRVIAFTHSNLEGDLENFIRDNKLRIVLIKVPSLRERISDISDLKRLMYELRQNIKSETGVTIKPTPAVVTCLSQYHWSSNLGC